LDYGQLELSNNLGENAIRPVAVGRNYEQLRIRQSLKERKMHILTARRRRETLRVIVSLGFSSLHWNGPFSLRIRLPSDGRRTILP
jgi:hypothetical protein